MCVTSCESIFFLFCRGWLGYFFLFGSINRREVEKKKSPLDMGTLRSFLNSFDSIDPAMFLSYLAEDLTSGRLFYYRVYRSIVKLYLTPKY